MKGLSVDQREQIRDAIDIVDLVGRYVPLKRQGKNFVGRCPWHDDRRPSLQVNPERQTFKCWVCNIGGDIFSFIMQAESVDFREALEMLADMAGVELKKESYRKKTDLFSSNDNFTDTEVIVDDLPIPSDPSGFSAAPNRGPSGFGNDRPFIAQEITKPVLYRALDWLAGKYHECFWNDPEAEPARQYIRDRGISPEMTERFRIGYAPIRPNYILDLINSDRNRTAVLVEAGVLFRRDYYHQPPAILGARLTEIEKSDYLDRFRGRVIFPIRDLQDRTVAFGGRVIPNGPLESPAKYVNSPETPIFSKFRMLYGLDLARTSLRKSGRVLITEGYTDCIMAHQFGFTDTVAALGTAVGTGHIKILKRFVDKMILLLDGDTAGRKRAREVLELFVAEGVDMSVLTLPDNADPCEFLLDKGADALEDLLQNGTCDAMDHAIQAALEGVDLQADIIGASKALDKILAIVALYPTNTGVNDPIRFRMALTIRRLSERFRISEREIRNSIREHRMRKNRRTYENEKIEFSGSQKDLFSQEENNPPDDRTQFTYPIAGRGEENDIFLQQMFLKFPREAWSDPTLQPSNLEQSYLEFWLTCPECFERLSKIVPITLLRAPVIRQLDALGRFLSGQGITPDFSQIILRYEDGDMKNFLVKIDEAAEKKDLKRLLQDNEERERLFRLLETGFAKMKLELEQPEKLNELRDSELSGEEKLSKLEELRQSLLRQQQMRSGGTAFTEENRSDQQ